MTAKKQMVAKLQSIKAELQHRRHHRTSDVGEWLRRVVLGYYQYHAVPGNTSRLRVFRRRVCRLWLSILVRRSNARRCDGSVLAHYWTGGFPSPELCILILTNAWTLAIIRGKSRMRKCAHTDLCGGRPVMVVPTAPVGPKRHFAEITQTRRAGVTSSKGTWVSLLRGSVAATSPGGSASSGLCLCEGKDLFPASTVSIESRYIAVVPWLAMLPRWVPSPGTSNALPHDCWGRTLRFRSLPRCARKSPARSSLRRRAWRIPCNPSGLSPGAASEESILEAARHQTGNSASIWRVSYVGERSARSTSQSAWIASVARAVNSSTGLPVTRMDGS